MSSSQHMELTFGTDTLSRTHRHKLRAIFIFWAQKHSQKQSPSLACRAPDPLASARLRTQFEGSFIFSDVARSQARRRGRRKSAWYTLFAHARVIYMAEALQPPMFRRQAGLST